MKNRVNNNMKNNNNYEEKGLMKSKIQVFFDWVWRLFVINTFTLLTSLGIITILPSLVANFRTLKECYEDDEQHITKRYFENFVYCFRDTVGVGCVFLVFFVLLIFSYFYYASMIDDLAATNSGSEWIAIASILLYLSIFIMVVLIMVYTQLPMVATYFHFRFFDKIKFSFYMAFKHFGATLCEMFVLLIYGLLTVLLLYYVPIVLAFITTIPMFLIYKISRKYYWFIVKESEYEYQNDEYDMAGKVQNRETYEDKPITEQEEAEKNLEEFNNKISKGE